MIRPKDRNPARTAYDPEDITREFESSFSGSEKDQVDPPEMDERESRKVKAMLNDPY